MSALTGEGLDELRERIAERFADRFEDVRLLVPYEEGTALSALYALGAPIERAPGHRSRRAHPREALAAGRAPLRPYLVAGRTTWSQRRPRDGAAGDPAPRRRGVAVAGALRGDAGST